MCEAMPWSGSFWHVLDWIISPDSVFEWIIFSGMFWRISYCDSQFVRHVLEKIILACFGVERIVRQCTAAFKQNQDRPGQRLFCHALVILKNNHIRQRQKVVASCDVHLSLSFHGFPN